MNEVDIWREGDNEDGQAKRHNDGGIGIDGVFGYLTDGHPEDQDAGNDRRYGEHRCRGETEYEEEQVPQRPFDALF